MYGDTSYRETTSKIPFIFYTKQCQGTGNYYSMYVYVTQYVFTSF